jgi:hypothetical protein
VYRARSKGRYGAMGQMGLDTAAGSRNITRAAFLSRIVNGTIQRRRGRVFVPVDAMVSVLDTTLCGAGADDEQHIPGMIT